jgi:hypothetical protein
MEAKADAQLLREYARQGSEAAFAEIVARYTDLVYSTVLRQAGSAVMAEEVAQSVFTDLARKAPALADKLRARLASQGITTSAAMLSTVLSTNAVQTAPAGMAARLAAASLAGAAAKTGTLLTLWVTGLERIPLNSLITGSRCPSPPLLTPFSPVRKSRAKCQTEVGPGCTSWLTARFRKRDRRTAILTPGKNSGYNNAQPNSPPKSPRRPIHRDIF